MKLKLLLPILFVIFASSSTMLFAQNKVNARMSLSYTKDYEDGPTIEAYIRYRENRTYFPAKNVKLSLFKQAENNSFKKIGAKETDEEGKAYFHLNTKTIAKGEQVYKVYLAHNSKFEDVSEQINFQDATINASIVGNDESRSIKVKLIDAEGKPVPRQYITIGLQRLFGQMQVGGEPYYKTDDQGEIVANIEQEFFSKNGKLNFIIKLDDSRTYGTIIEKVTADFGTQMESKDTFDERTMWSTAMKAPLYVLIFPNIILISVWGTLLFLVYNLYKIFKLK